ncbi:TonB-dependent receptor family protein [Mucilaginibacter roseus]|uniref:TonB-dependent receptor family protein n=1 Tax=Mucilaginibacter roseus TaxID=1528868 RepID=A0ABS8U2M3_9SPHI|nr:outer membrane beta-barrel protein [Mucilaginibacter roseus]MCD8740034.1 TonB-dependent receptor family protein [Mucilaginibacter roseus]
MKKLLLTFFTLTIFISANAQTARQVTGSVVDSANVTLPGISVKLVTPTDSVSTATDMEGKFKFPAVKGNTFKLMITGIGYEIYKGDFKLTDEASTSLKPIKLKTQYNLLGIVNITALKPPITIKQDTVEYNAAAYKVRDGSPTEDLLKKMPGIEVDKDGNINAHGKAVTKVRVNGKDFFAGDPKLATQNLPADIVENIQVIDDYGDQANLTGIKTGEPAKILNITIKKNRNVGNFGRLNAGVGNEKRFNTRVFANHFNNQEQISVLGNFNNTDGNQNGINTQRSGQIRYSNEFGKKIKIDGRYSIDDNDRNTITSSLREELYTSGAITRNNQSNNTNWNTSHHVDFNLEYKPDTLNFFKISPNFNTNTSGNDNKLDFINNRNGVTDVGQQYNNSNNRSPSYGGNFLFNHRFKKKGRNFSINLNANSSDNTNNAQDLYNAQNQQTGLRDTIYQQINTAGSTDRFGSSISYTEPLSQTTFLEANYNYSYTNNKNDRFNYRINPYTNELTYVDSLSTVYNYQFINNRFGLNLRSIKTKYNLTLGMGFQPTTLQGEFQGTRTSRNTVNYIPNANFIYKFTPNRTLTFNFNGSNQQPSFYQLQPKPDLSNPQNRVYGNPDLKPEFNMRYSLRFNQFNVQSGNSLFVNLDYNTTANNIVSNTKPVRLDDTSSTQSTGRLIQETRYLNTDGFYSINGNYAFTTKPFTNKSFTVSLNGSSNYNNQVTFIESERNLVKNLVLTQGLKFRADIDSVMDTEISGSYSINTSKNSLTNDERPLNRNVNTWNLGLDGRNYFFDGWILGYNIYKQINSGFGSRSVNPTIISTYIEYQFLAQNSASFRLQGFDLLNQNTGISRSVNGNVTVDSRTNRLGRYFLFTFSYRFRKFAGRGMGGGGRGERREGGSDRGGRGNGGGGGGGGGRRG